jgi:hypothetical protein
MPDWINNTFVLYGSAEDLQAIYDTGFDFATLYPSPPALDNDGREDWWIRNWGTKWPAQNIEMELYRDMGTLRVQCQTAWVTPHIILSHLTAVRYPNVRITSVFEHEKGPGQVVYDKGNISGTCGSESIAITYPEIESILRLWA